MDWREQANIFEQRPQRKPPPPTPTFSDASSSQGSSSSSSWRRLPRDSEPAAKMVKLICNFGGRFLPRPSDGELRYVGGDRRLLRIRRDISWRELVCKTTRLVRRAHAIKYHLPGEPAGMLISITSDDDLRHMVDECVALRRSQERLTMYLFSTGDDDERQLHLVAGTGSRSASSDAEKEAQFIALVNGLVGPGDEPGRQSHHGNSSSANDLHQLMLDITEKESKPPSSQPRTAQGNEGGSNLASAARSSRAQLGGNHSVPRHQPGVALQRATASQEQGSPRKELLVAVAVDHGSTNAPAPPSNANSSSPTRSDGTMMRPATARRHTIPGEAAPSQPGPDPLRKNGKASEPSPSHGSGASMGRSDDVYASANMQAVEKPAAASGVQKQWPVAPATSSGGTEAAPSSDKAADHLQPNILVRASSERQQERVGSPRPDESSSRTARSRSVGAGSVGPQIRASPSQEAEDDHDAAAAPTISDAVVLETKKSGEQALPEDATLGTDLISNVQIISNEDLEDLREMGSGAFGTVFHGKWRGTDVAIKRIKNSCFMYPSSQADKLIVEFWREAAIISKLHHPNILAFYGIVKNGPGGTLATVTEFMVNGSLKKVLVRKDRYLDWRRRVMLAMDAAIGMEYLHSKDIVHFDLKCDNLLVNIKDPSRPICKVADFGLSKMKQASLVSGGMRGTLPWMAPELLTMSGTKVTEKVDVYSFAIVMWEILTGEDPYDGMHYGGVIGGILSNTLRPPVPSSCNPEWRRLMEQCWSTEPERRPSFTEVASRLRAMLEATRNESLI